MKADTDELKIIREIDAEIRKLDNRIRKIPTEEAAYLVVKQFFECEDVTDEMRESFHDWLLDSKNQDAKDKAMWRMFQEMYVRRGEPSEDACKELEEIQVRLNFPQKQHC